MLNLSTFNIITISILCLIVTKNSQASTFFIEPELAITHSSIGNNKGPQSSLIDRSIDPSDKANSSGLKYSELNNSSSLGLSAGVKIQRLEFRFSYIDFGESTSSSKVNKYKYSFFPGSSLKKEIDDSSEMGVKTTRTAFAHSYAISYHNPMGNNFSWKPSFGILSWSLEDKSQVYTIGDYEEVKQNENRKYKGYNIFFGITGSYIFNEHLTLNLNTNRYLFGASAVISTGLSLRANF